MEVIGQIGEGLSYGFVQRALMAGVFTALSCSCLGVFLVLKRFALIGDGLAHVSLAAVGLGLLLGISPLWTILPVAAIAALFLLQLNEKTAALGDSAVGVVSTMGVATAIMLTSLAGGFNTDLFSFLFGSILAVSPLETALSAGLAAIVAVCVAFFYNDLFAVTFDEEHARASGLKAGAVNRLLVVLTALTVGLGIRVVGALLVSSLIILPTLTALQLAASFRTAIVAAATVGVAAVVGGIMCAYVFDLPAGACIVYLNFTVFAGAFGLKKLFRM